MLTRPFNAETPPSDETGRGENCNEELSNSARNYSTANGVVRQTTINLTGQRKCTEQVAHGTATN